MKTRTRVSAAGLFLAVCAHVSADAPGPALRITSPLGRTGLPGTIRIVARLDHVHPDAAVQVHFYVDRLFLSSDTDGPPYEARWSDENPFERHELLAQADIGTDALLSSMVVLNPMPVNEAAEVNSVALEAAIVNEHGQFVRDLTASDFDLLEDLQPQAIDSFAQKREPALFAVLVDSSQSMALRADLLRATAARLLDALAPEDQVLVAPFSRHVLSVTGPTTDRPTALSAISDITPSGGTAILDALQDVGASLRGGTRRRAIVLITDGYDEHSTVEFDETVDVLRRSDLTLYVIGIGGVAGVSLKGEDVLSSLAERTGGRAWFPLDRHRLATAYEAVAADVQHRYFVTYTPKNQRRDGTYRTITLKPRGARYKVRTREGYVAPLAPPIRTSLEFTAIGTGQTAISLTRDDLVVFEDGVPQEVDTFHESLLPVTIMLALDSSGSMKRSAAEAQQAARDFVRAVRPDDALGMILFANTSNYIHSPTERRDWSLEAIDAYVADGGTALYDAVYDSLAQIADVPGRRVVVVVTDGRDENAASSGPGSTRTWEDVLRKLRQAEATVYPVGIGSRVDRARLQELADRSGGSAFFPADVTSLPASYDKILDEIRRRYVVGYQSTNRLRDGNWRSVTIDVRQGGVTVKSRGGYYGPREP
jgi:Ca-activated chloride channel family protein